MADTTQTQQTPKSSGKKWLITGAIVLVIVWTLSSLYGSFKTNYNTMNGLSVDVDTMLSQIDVQTKRRSDLVPALVEVVRGEANFEKSTLDAVISARSRATSIQLTPEVLNNPELMAKFKAAQGDLTTALSRLMVVTEQYPNLRANDAFKGLRVSLEGTENRIGVARQRYNEAVQALNKFIGNFPANIFAWISGYHTRPFYTADEASKNAPTFKF